MKHWSHWEFKRFGIELRTIWGWGDRRFNSVREWIPYQTLLSFGRLRLHCFHRGDGDEHPHDHMWDFVTFPLTSYVEKVYEPLEDGQMRSSMNVVRAGRFHRRPAEYRHIVLGRLDSYDFHFDVGERVGPGRIWTIVWVSRKRRDWGFWVGGDVIHWYDDARRKWRWDKREARMIPWREYIYDRRRS